MIYSTVKTNPSMPTILAHLSKYIFNLKLSLMRDYIKILAVCVLSFLALDSKAQTKEETLEWFKLNGKSLSSFNFKSEPCTGYPLFSGFYQISTIYYRYDLTIDTLLIDCEAYVKIYKSEDDFHVRTIRTNTLFKIPYKDIFIEDVDKIRILNNCGGWYDPFFGGDYSEKCLPDKYVGLNLQNRFNVTTTFKESVFFKYDSDKDKQDNYTKESSRKQLMLCYDNIDDFKRVLKAIMHMAKLSGAPENIQRF